MFCLDSVGSTLCDQIQFQVNYQATIADGTVVINEVQTVFIL